MTALGEFKETGAIPVCGRPAMRRAAPDESPRRVAASLSVVCADRVDVIGSRLAEAQAQAGATVCYSGRVRLPQDRTWDNPIGNPLAIH